MTGLLDSLGLDDTYCSDCGDVMAESHLQSDGGELVLVCADCCPECTD